MKLITNKTLKESIRERLTEEIKHCGLSQVEIAKRVHITPAVLSDYIHKNKLPSLETFALLCDTLEISSDDILGLN